MKIDRNQLKGPPERVGKLRGEPVFLMQTKGGFNIVYSQAAGRVIGSAPHKGLAKHIATLNEKDVEFDELSKAEPFDPSLFQNIIQDWLEVTDRLNEGLDA